MIGPFTRIGKQILANGFHYADAADETAAEHILVALTLRAILEQAWTASRPSRPDTQNVEAAA